MRTCVVTKEQFPKKELIRVVRSPEGIVSIDEKGKLPGRGAYLKLSKAIVNKAKKTKVLDGRLEISIPDEIYDQLLKLADE